MKALLFVLSLVISTPGGEQGLQAPTDSWLDQSPLKGWNSPGGEVPGAPAGTGGVQEDRADLLQRCKLVVNTKTPSDSAVAGAGWIPFRLFDREIVRGDVEIVGGMAGADGMCRPAPFNVFVFVGGRFAGTLSPEPMTSRLDGSIGAARLVEDDLVSAEFARYGPDDPLCCPSSRVTVRYRIDRTTAQPVVTPLDVRKTR